MKLLFTTALFLTIHTAFTQTSGKIITSDIDHFWEAYDSIQTTEDFSEKLDFINELYISRGTAGLEMFMKLRDYNDSLYVQLIEKYPKFWNSVRPNTLTVKDQTDKLANGVERLRALYPELREATMYFTIGGLASGGTTTEEMVLVGAEIATANPSTDVSEFETDWLKGVFAAQSLDHVVSLNIHEYIHTQQYSDESQLLLSQGIREGACDFMAELALEIPLQRDYLTYGKEHFEELKRQFKKEMFSLSYTNWLYNGGQKGEQADLGYFIGHAICGSYYDRAEDNAKAIKEIIEVDYSSVEEVVQFLATSGFFERGFDQELSEFNSKRPFIERIEPFDNGTDGVAPTTTSFRIVFSQEMNPKRHSLNYSEQGKEAWPINKLVGFENNNQTLVLGIQLESERTYEFIINCDGFSSRDGYPLQGGQYLVSFTTN